MIYAQIDDKNTCVAISVLNSEIDDNTLIPMKEYDISLLGKKYNNGIFEETN